MHITKKRKEQERMYEKNRLYEPKEAIELIKKLATSKFDESVEVHIKLGVNPKHADQQVRSTCVLPEGTGKKLRIAVFAKGEPAKEAEEYKADIVGDDSLIEKIKKGFLDFDSCIATPDMMRSVGQIGKILGPRGLMPNPKSGTVTFEIGKAISEIRSGKIEYRCDEYGIVHTAIGKASFDREKIYKNFVAFMDSILKAKPSSAKGQYIKTITMASTMSPGIKIDPRFMRKALE